MSRRISILMLLLVITTWLPAKTNWLAKFNSDIIYDRNIFCLSPSDLDRYRQRIEPERFPYRSADDLKLMLNAELTGRFSKSTSLIAGLRIHNYAVNQEKSYGLLRCKLEQGIGSSSRLAFYSTWLPDYLIRYYRTPNNSQFRPCRFGEWLAGADYEQRFRTLRIIPGYRFEFYNYIPPFEYYNTRAHRFDARLDCRPERNLNLQTRYYFKIAQAKGPVPDISYNEHDLFVKIATRPRRLNRFGIKSGYEYSYRSYTTDNPPAVDPAHANRVDRIQCISLGADYELELFTIYFQYEFEWRDVQSPYKQQIEEIKEYRTTRVGLGVTLRLRMQLQGSEAQGGEE
ncbi:MAG: hypothetical protein ACP5JB_01245 [candidate division WOR-3 bacterium]